ncbi:MAG: ferritin family protein [Sedimentisphaerales bacterium]|nr:ferritin family protein [Sedimentisphaerales bacterium]
MVEQSLVVEAIKYAIQQEENDIAFYQQWAEKSNTIKVRKLFETLAGIEATHAQTLKEVLAKERNQPSSTWKTITQLAKYVIDEEKRLIANDDNSSLAQVFRVAIAKEEMAFKLYTDMSKGSPDSQVADIFLGLAQDEAVHKLRLEEEYKNHLARQLS